MREEKKVDKETAIRYLLHYDQLKKEYETEKQGALAKHGGNAGGHSSQPGAPTEQAALASIAYDESHEEYTWLKTVEFVQKTIGERKSIFLACRREVERQKCGQWVVPTQTRFADALKERFFDNGAWISERTVRNYWWDLVGMAVEIHLRLQK